MSWPLFPTEQEVARGSRAHSVEDVGTVRDQELSVPRQDLEELVVPGPGLGHIVLLQGSLHHAGRFVLTGKQDAAVQVPVVVVDADSDDAGL